MGCPALDPCAGDVAELRTFFVSPEYKRRGIGKRLYRAVLTIAQSQGYKRLVVDADTASTPFYEAFGFKLVRMTKSRAIAGRMRPHFASDI